MRSIITPVRNNVVRDIVHPALYAYVKDQTPLRKQLVDEGPCTLHAIRSSNDAFHPERQDDDDDDKDFWGRTYETSKYQWLSTYFTILPSGRCIIEDYINNLSPRNDPVKSPLYESLSKLFERCLPFIESVYGYVRTVRPNMMTTDRDGSEGLDEADEYGPLDTTPCSLRGQRLQVITKIVDYELRPGQSHSGVWHVEGMSHEEIILTALYVVDRDDRIRGGGIQFKRASFRDEAKHIFYNVPQIRARAAEGYIATGLTPLGTVETPRGRLIVFPNCHVHRVNDMVHAIVGGGDDDDDDDDVSIGKRRIVVFFLVNPFRRIVSTREVAPQQATAEDGWMTFDDARAHRLQLMEERKYHKQDWNVREIELCEH